MRIVELCEHIGLRRESRILLYREFVLQCIEATHSRMLSLFELTFDISPNKLQLFLGCIVPRSVDLYASCLQNQLN